MAVKRNTSKRTEIVNDSSPVSENRNSMNVTKRKMPKYFWPLLLAIILGGVFYFTKSWFVAALVNGKPISRFTLVKNLEKSGGKQALDNLVTKELIEQEARKNNILVADEEIQKEIDNLSKTVESQGSTLDAALTAQGMTKKDLQDNIKLQKTVELLMADEVKVSDEEVKKYFDDNKASYGKDAKFDDLKDSIKQDLAHEKISTEFQTWYQKLQSESDIKYFLTF